MGQAGRARAVELALGVGVALLAVLALVLVGGREPPAPAETPVASEGPWAAPTTPYLWPENWARAADRAELALAQERADAGDPDVAWRSDPEIVVERFVTIVLGWDDAEIRRTRQPSVSAYRASPPCAAAPCPGVLVVVDRPARSGEGGVWSVVGVVSGPLDVDASGGVLDAGSALRLRLRLPPATTAHAGLVASNDCGESSVFEPELESGEPTLTVPAAEPGHAVCGAVGAGYVFVYVTDDATVPVGDPLLEAATIERPWLTMLPVEVQMIEASDVAG